MAIISNKTNQNHKDSITFVISKISYYKLNLILKETNPNWQTYYKITDL